jgi:hypothetical protein
MIRFGSRMTPKPGSGSMTARQIEKSPKRNGMSSTSPDTSAAHRHASRVMRSTAARRIQPSNVTAATSANGRTDSYGGRSLQGIS